MADDRGIQAGIVGARVRRQSVRGLHDVAVAAAVADVGVDDEAALHGIVVPGAVVDATDVFLNVPRGLGLGPVDHGLFAAGIADSSLKSGRNRICGVG